MLSWLTNPAVLGGVLLIVAGAILTYKFWRWDRPRGRKRCPKCWYDLSGHATVERCPECGHEPRSEQHLYRTRRKRGLAAFCGVIFLIGVGLVSKPGVLEESYVQYLPTRVLIMMLGRIDAPDLVEELVARLDLNSGAWWGFGSIDESKGTDRQRALFVQRALALITDQTHPDDELRADLLRLVFECNALPDDFGRELVRLTFDDSLGLIAFHMLGRDPRYAYVATDQAILNEARMLAQRSPAVPIPEAFVFALTPQGRSVGLYLDSSIRELSLQPINLQNLNDLLLHAICRTTDSVGRRAPFLPEIMTNPNVRLATRILAAERLARRHELPSVVIPTIAGWIESGAIAPDGPGMRSLLRLAEWSPGQIKLFAEMLHSREPVLREIASQALSSAMEHLRLSDDEMNTLIHIAAHDPDWLVRAVAANTVNELPIEHLRPYQSLLAHAAKEDAHVAEHLRKALQRLELDAAEPAE